MISAIPTATFHGTSGDFATSRGVYRDHHGHLYTENGFAYFTNGSLYMHYVGDSEYVPLADFCRKHGITDGTISVRHRGEFPYRIGA